MARAVSTLDLTGAGCYLPVRPWSDPVIDTWPARTRLGPPSSPRRRSPVEQGHRPGAARPGEARRPGPARAALVVPAPRTAAGTSRSSSPPAAPRSTPRWRTCGPRGRARHAVGTRLGCGAGRLTCPRPARRPGHRRRRLRRHGRQGADARHRGWPVRSCSTRDDLSLDDGAFDLTYSSLVLAAPAAAERPAWPGELARVTRPGGALIVGGDRDPRRTSRGCCSGPPAGALGSASASCCATRPRCGCTPPRTPRPVAVARRRRHGRRATGCRTRARVAHWTYLRYYRREARLTDVAAPAVQTVPVRSTSVPRGDSRRLGVAAPARHRLRACSSPSR